ncbi:hypothetical protein ACF0H5_010088 [Mactra antiquata]
MDKEDGEKGLKKLLQLINKRKIVEINHRLISDAKDEINSLQQQWNGFCRDRNTSVDIKVIIKFLGDIKESLIKSSLSREISKLAATTEKVEQEYNNLCDYCSMRPKSASPSPVSGDEQKIKPMSIEEQGPEPMEVTPLKEYVDDNDVTKSATESPNQTESNTKTTAEDNKTTTEKETDKTKIEAIKADVTKTDNGNGAKASQLTTDQDSKTDDIKKDKGNGPQTSKLTTDQDSKPDDTKTDNENGPQTSQLTTDQDSTTDVTKSNNRNDPQASQERTVQDSNIVGKETNKHISETDDYPSKENARKELDKPNDTDNTPTGSIEDLNKPSATVTDVVNFIYDPSILESLLTEDSYKNIVEEYCELFNEDREDIIHTLVNKQIKCMAEASKYVYKLLKSVYEYTADCAKNQLDKIIEKAKSTIAVDSKVDVKLNEDLVELLRQYQGVHGLLGLPQIKQGYQTPPQLDIKTIPKLEMFIQKCVELTWCICLHQPMTSLDFNTKFHNRADLMAVYRSDRPGRQGNRIEEVTWPPLRLTADGTVLTKGVARLR